MSLPNKGLIVQPGLIGDGLLTLPLANQIRDTLELDGMALCCPAVYGGFLLHRSALVEVYDHVRCELHRLHDRMFSGYLPASDPLRMILSDFRWVLMFAFDEWSTFSDHFRSLCRSLGIPKVYLLKFTPPDIWKDHVLDWHAHQLRRGGFPLEGPSKDWRLDQTIHYGADDINYHESIKARMGIQTSPPYVVLVPGSGVLWKNVHIDNWLEIALRLRDGGTTVLWLTGPAEDAWLDESMRDRLTQTGEVIQTSDLLFSLMTLGAASVVIANDCAMAHLSSGAGTKTLTLFAATQMSWYLPAGPCSAGLQVYPDSINRKDEETICRTMRSFYKLSSA